MKWFALMVIAMCLAVSLIAATAARADETEYSLFTTVYVKHFSDGDYNESNQLIGVSYNNWFGCTFENSNYNRSWFLGYSFRTKKYAIAESDFFLRGNLHTGALYGYDDDMPNIGGWTVAAAPTGEIGYKNFSIELLAAPFDGGVIISMLRFSF